MQKKTIGKDDFVTDNIMVMAAIELISGIVPDDFMVMLEPNKPKYDKAWAVYRDKSKLPKKIEYAELMKFASMYRKCKEDCFREIKLARMQSDPVPKEEIPPRDKKKTEEKKS